MKENLAVMNCHEDIIFDHGNHKIIIDEQANSISENSFPDPNHQLRAVKKVKANYDMFTLMSALQKSIRWCEVNASRYFAKELVEMGKPGAVINRLLIIASEDVGLADPSLLNYVRECSNTFEGMLKAYNIKRSEVHKFQNVCSVIDEAVIAAALSFKSRLLPMMTFVTLFDIYKIEPFNHDLQEYLDRFHSSVQVQDKKMALYYAFISVVVFGAELQFYSMVHKEIERKNRDLIRDWVMEYKKSKEMMVLSGIVALLCRDLNFPYGEYQNLISQQMPLPVSKTIIPDRAYDMHTILGRKKGRGYEHFFREAASVRNERFPNDWEEIGKRAYLRADKEGLAKAPDLFKAIKNKARVKG